MQRASALFRLLADGTRLRLLRLLADCAGMPAATVPERIEQVVEEWLDGGPHDDIAVLALQPGESRPSPPSG